MRKLYSITMGILALLMALVLTLNPLATPSSYASSLDPYPTLNPHTGKTTNWTNVYTGPSTSDRVVTVYPPRTSVIIYATVSGQAVWGGISTWYRISIITSASLYIYGGLVIVFTDTRGVSGDRSPSSRGSPSPKGKEIIIPLSRQWMDVYENGRKVYTAPIISGQPALPTPTGTYHVFRKLHPTTFYSPWPQGSPYYYPPTHITYALGWRVGGYFLHDAWWHSTFGPGTNVQHRDRVYGWETGTHGCVAIPLYAAAWLYNWAPIGTTVQVNP